MTGRLVIVDVCWVILCLLCGMGAGIPAWAQGKAGPSSQAVLLELTSTKTVYRAQDAMLVTADLWATRPVMLCLYPTRPEANFVAEVSRAGYGSLNLGPSVVQLTPEEKNHVQRVPLDTGRHHRVTLNLKKLVPLPPGFWKTGEYRIQVKFFLCGTTEQAEQAIPSQSPLHLLVLE